MKKTEQKTEQKKLKWEVVEDINFKPFIVDVLPPKMSSSHKSKTLEDYSWWSTVLFANGKWVAVRKGKYTNIQACKSLLHKKYKDKVESTTRAQKDKSTILYVRLLVPIKKESK